MEKTGGDILSFKYLPFPVNYAPVRGVVTPVNTSLVQP